MFHLREHIGVYINRLTYQIYGVYSRSFLKSRGLIFNTVIQY